MSASIDTLTGPWLTLAVVCIRHQILDELGTPARMRGAYRLGLTGVVQVLLRVLPDGLQQPVPRLAAGRVGLHEGACHQAREQLEDVGPVDDAAGGHGFGGIEREAPGEHAQPVEHPSLGLVEQVVRPVDRGAERLVALGRAALAAREQAEALVEALGELGRREHRDPCRGELDRERHAVESSAHLRDRGGVALVDREAGPHRLRPLDEEPHRVARRDLVDVARSASGTSSEPTARIRSPGSPSPSRLVARTRTPGHSRTIVPTSAATGRSRCSQLSSTTRRSLAARNCRSVSSMLEPGAARRRTSPATAPATASGSRTLASSQSHAPSRKRCAVALAISIASRVLPTPPTPVSVTSGVSSSRAGIARSSSSCPTNDVS